VNYGNHYIVKEDALDIQAQYHLSFLYKKESFYQFNLQIKRRIM
jgi:hypothetical protein